MPAVLQDSRFGALRQKERSGSRARCILLTDGEGTVVAQRLTSLIEPFGVVDHNKHYWMPRGFAAPREARLGEAVNLLSTENRALVSDWWLAVRHPKANTPNWDIAFTARIDEREGLVLVEAKAHENELSAGGKAVTKRTNTDNRKQIEACCVKAGEKLNACLPGWNLSATRNYQLCNRFAWAWKVATLGIPVVLVYLGFLDADEMPIPLRSGPGWKALMRAHSDGIVPDTAWDAPIMVGVTPLYASIRAMRVGSDGRVDFIPC